MQRESYSTVTQFCDDTSFRNWASTGRDEAGWAIWLDANPDKAQLARQARMLILAIGTESPDMQAGEADEALAQTWSRIRQHEGGRVVRFAVWWRAAAAVLILGVGLVWYFSYKYPGQQRAAGLPGPAVSGANGVMALHNASRVARLINLEDGSTIILQPGSRLSYPVKFAADRREVHLSGEAFFEISKNRRRPFLVYTHDIVTEVVGTSFRIKAPDDQPEVEVFVKTGQVHVRQIKAGNTADKVVLLPNQSVSFLKSQHVFEKPETKDIPKRAIEYLNFDFTDAHVETIFAAIESAYGVTIEYPKDAFRDCYLSTSLADEPLLSKLKIVCESISSGTQFRMEGDRVIIESTGCN